VVDGVSWQFGVGREHGEKQGVAEGAAGGVDAPTATVNRGPHEVGGAVEAHEGVAVPKHAARAETEGAAGRTDAENERTGIDIAGAGLVVRVFIDVSKAEQAVAAAPHHGLVQIAADVTFAV